MPEKLFDNWKEEGRYWVRLSDGLRLPIIQGGGKAVVVQRAAWAFGTDNGTESGHSLDTANVARTSAGSGAQAVDTPFLIRIGIGETAGGTASQGYALFAQKNGSGGYTEVTTARTDGIRITNDVSGRTDDESTTQRLAAGGGTFTAGRYDDGQSNQGTGNISMSTQYSEVEFCIEIDSANATEGDYWDLRAEVADGTDLASYSGTMPRVEAGAAPSALTVADIAHSHTLDAAGATKPNPTGFTFIQSNISASTSSTITLNGVTAGSLIVLVAKQATDIDPITGVSDGTDAFTAATQVTVNGGMSAQIWYLLESTSGNKTYTVSFPVGAASTRLIVAEFGYTGTVSYDDDNTGSGNSAAAATGNITASGGNNLLFASSTPWSGLTPSNWDINDEAFHGRIEVNTTMHGWYLFTDATGTMNASNDWSGSDYWLTELISFKLSTGDALTVADIAHGNTLDTVVLTSHQVIPTANDIAHANALDAVVLISHQVIPSVEDVQHNNFLDGQLALTAGAVIPTVNDIDHSNTLDSVALTSHDVIPAVNDIQHDNTLDAVTLTSHQVIPEVSDLQHDNTLDAVVLGSGVDLTVNDVQHDNTLDAVSLTNHNALTVQDIQHDNALDGGFILTFGGVLVNTDIQHDNSVDSVVLTFSAAGSLSPNDIQHDNVVDSPVLAFTPGGETLSMSENIHDNNLDSVVLTSHNAVVIADITHANALDGIIVTYNPHYVLLLNDVLHGNSLDAVVLTHVPAPVALTVDDVWHQHRVDGFRFGEAVVSFMHDHDDFMMFWS